MSDFLSMASLVISIWVWAEQYIQMIVVHCLVSGLGGRGHCLLSPPLEAGLGNKTLVTLVAQIQPKHPETG